MAIRPIIIAPDPRLKKRAQPVESVDAELRRLMDDLLETMYAAPGVGLAAPQVGVLKRIIVVDAARKDEPQEPLFLANPELLWAAEAGRTYEEGCLSLPDQFADVIRPEACRVRYLDRDNKTREIEAATVVMTTSRTPQDALYYALCDRIQIQRIGDCLAPGTIAAAVYSGHRCARDMDAEVTTGVPFLRE